MITAVDTNILLDILIPDAPYGAASQQSLDTALQQGILVLNEMVYAELTAHFPTQKELELFLADTSMRLVPSQPAALARAGQAWAAYTHQRGPGFQELADQIDRELDETKRKVLVAQAEAIMEQDPPVLPVAWEKINDAWYNYVKGHNPYNYFGMFDVVRFDTFWLDI